MAGAGIKLAVVVISGPGPMETGNPAALERWTQIG